MSDSDSEASSVDISSVEDESEVQEEVEDEPSEEESEEEAEEEASEEESEIDEESEVEDSEVNDELAPLEDDLVQREVYSDDEEDDDDDEEDESGRGAPASAPASRARGADDDDEEDEEEDSALLLAKQEKFFERLSHFMNVQRKVEERMKRIDPKGRLKEIEMTDHSGGLLEEDGTYKTKYQQQDAEGEIARNLGEVYEAAYQIKQSLRDLLDKIVDKVKGLDYVDAKIVELKPRDRANKKAREEYLTRLPGPPETWLWDVLRSSITCKTIKQMESVNKYLGKKAHIVQSKNRFVSPAYSGYRDLLYHVLIDWQYKENVFFVAEIQVHHKEVNNIEKMLGTLNHYKYFRPFFAGPNRTVVETMRDLDMLLKKGKIDDETMDTILDFDNADQLTVFGKLFNQKLEDYNRCLQVYSRVLTLQESSIGELHPDTAATYQAIGLVQAKKGYCDMALRNLQKCLEIQEEVFGAYSPEVAITRSHLGNTIRKRGESNNDLMEHRGALQQYRKALVIRERCLGEDHLDVADSYQHIGESLCQLGDFEGALAAYRESLSILESLLGENHADVAASHSLLGGVLHHQGDFEGSMEEYEIALAIREEVFGKSHQMTAKSHTEIGILLSEVEDYDEAEGRHRKALRIRETVCGRESPEVADSQYQIGFVLNQKGNYQEALAMHQNAYQIREKILGMKHAKTLASLQSIHLNEQGEREGMYEDDEEEEESEEE
eukprot:CAMPEP_0119562770 /NCGR_PEP_ID=MMETSP1352-20130426/21491_1 /TAXON_ID=265584 /ORGANISM="Stauroneis constricta, Strain CCMP1120" /LENGTH=721 /DNA_ID=CAMNT_0007611241 /DNA_START=152 /DNA_END=2317 /DNA_ORIENTATION=+